MAIFPATTAKDADGTPNWITPAATDGRRGGTLTEAMTGTSLVQQVNSVWPTATAKDADGARSFTLTGERIRANAGQTLTDSAATWPAPMAGTPAQNGNNAAGNNDSSRKTDQMAMELLRKVWSTPRASDAEKGGPNQKFGAGGTPLPAQAAQWPTPAARDGKGANSPDHLENGTGRKHMDQLPNAVAHGFTPRPCRSGRMA
jgi:hypothetical protein